jgi:excisionase family DNA binding protein
MDKLLLSISDFCEATSLGPTLVKGLIREGRLPSVKVGDRRLIPAQAAREFVARLLMEAGTTGAPAA